MKKEKIRQSKVLGKMRELGVTQAWMAEELKVTTNTINRKLTGERPITLPEAKRISEMLNGEIEELFFIEEVSRNDTLQKGEQQ